jgi:phosphate transport system permease protein
MAQTTTFEKLSRKRSLTNVVMCGAICAAVLVALVPLVAVLSYTVLQGADRISWEFLTHSMNGVGPLDANGGAYHAIIGTLQHVAIAYAIAVPLGLMVAIYIAEVGRGSLAAATRFIVDVMTGIPSIVAGLFIFSFWVIALDQGFSGLAAGLALAILMLPTVVRSAEEMLKLVPNELREASAALGISKWRSTLSVVVPAASSGIVTGVLLAVARVTGETAPLLLTAFGFDAIRNSPVDGPQSGLPLYVFSQAGSAFDVAVERAWAGALTLMVIVMLLIVVARVVAARRPAVSS